MGIRKIQAIIIKEDDKFFIDPKCNGGEDSGCYLNGNPIIEKSEILHLDRLTFGTNNMFIVIIPDGESGEEKD
jgi:hypothetical protein